MKLAVSVLGREVALLEQAGDFKSVLSYHAHAAPDDFVSLTMPVRTESYVWDDQLPPVLQMNLPEGYLLQVLQEQFGPHIGASPMALLSVIGRNMIGRLQVAAPGAELTVDAKPIEVAQLLRGDNSEQAFAELVRQHATSEPYHYAHEWEVGDSVMWDNTGTLHRAMPYDPDCGRLLKRTTLLGEEEFS